jgi:hypothetical protein
MATTEVRATEELAPAQSSRLLPALIFTALTIVLIISRFYHPAPNPEFVLCGFKTVVGLPCPGCGLTRAFCALAKGDIGAAFSFNLIGPLLFIFTLAGWAISLLALAGRRAGWQAMSRLLNNVRLIKYTIIFVAIFWAARIIYQLTTLGWAATVGKGLLAQLWR